MTTWSTSILFILYVFSTLSSTECANGTISAVIAFGDSILDTGNNNNLNTMTKCNFPPYGRNFPGGLPTGRFGDGKVFSDLIVEGLGIKDILPAYLDRNLKDADLSTGVCFASGGSGLDSLTARIQSVLSVSDQLHLFKQYITKLEAVVGKEKSNAIISNALFLVSSGNDDIAITYYSLRLRSQFAVSSYTSLLVTLASNFTKDLYGLGARRIAFMGTLPLGCLPAARATVGGILCAETVNQAAQIFNSKLSSELSALNNSLSEAKIFYLDVYSPLLDLIQNPQKSGN
ncbi:GDSL esterase/lipase At1g23500-like [Hevea brasiliensis]|uniref:GDSL esterase/lipase At1g23500-like n=1 Tax=Hevea brasiliensis TaxID=3981 RepID=UPI0025FB69C0|nr:GDSL esterase/lipase At1g23500-like [Hevea brasiliensis]